MSSIQSTGKNSIYIGRLLNSISVIPGNKSTNFPLDNCSGDDIDILFLYTESKYGGSIFYHQNQLIRQFVDNFKRDPKNKTSSGLQFAEVFDKFSTHNLNIDVSSWTFHSTRQADTYGSFTVGLTNQPYRPAGEVLNIKIQFVQRLFSEMAGVRKNVSLVAVIFLDGVEFSLEETRNIPDFVRQQDTEIKIFVLVVGVKYGKEIVHLSDTVLIPDSDDLSLVPKLTLAMCKQCEEGWSQFVHSASTDSVSCYKLVNLPGKVDWFGALRVCNYYNVGSLGAIETREELNYLQTSLYRKMKEFKTLGQDSVNSTQYSVQVYIGLSRNLTSVAKRFQWSLNHPTRYRPLVVNHWSPGKPSGGFNSACGVWQFVWSDPQNGHTNVSGLAEGWADIGCRTKLTSLVLCEVVFPRRIEDQTMMRIKPAANESLNQTLTKADLVIFTDNIVSVSANIANSHFLKFLKETDYELFPMFDCGDDSGDSRYISYVYVCDCVDHCSNRRDELFCGLHPLPCAGHSTETSCYGVHCCDGSCLPLRLVNDGEIDCLVCEINTDDDVSDESQGVITYMQGIQFCLLMCDDGDCMRFPDLIDSLISCNVHDPPLHPLPFTLDERIRKLEAANSCTNSLGQSVWAPRCVYVKDTDGAVLGCRDMSHLKDCSNFVCPDGYVKCPNNYCIPQHYVRDGHEDCPSGEDEQLYNIGSCSGNFACWGSNVCLHPDLVCDTHRDCPHGDDEIDCRVDCFTGCRCVSGTITVSDNSKSEPLTSLAFVNNKTRYMNLSGIDLTEVDTAMDRHGFINIVDIVWSNCKIRRLYHVLNTQGIDLKTELNRVHKLDISYNSIHEISLSEIYPTALDSLRHLNASFNQQLSVVHRLPFKFLEILDLSHTSLSHLDEYFLKGLPNLEHLNLSFTFISGFRENVFPSNMALQTLDVRGLPLDDFYEDSFNGLTISQHLYTDSFESCCPQVRGANIPYYTCHAPDDAISSCFDLLGLNVQRVLLWVVAVLTVLGNLTVIGYRVVWDRSVLGTGYGLFVTNLGISDFIMGVYLLIIAGADYYYRGVYVLYDKTWRESMTCRLAGFLATLSSETSTFFAFLITLDRFLVIKFPFGQFKLSRTSTTIILVLSWFIGFLLALAPVVFRFEIYSANAMCLGLPLTTKRLNGWQFSFSVFIVLNFCMFLVIAYGQRAIFGAMSENRITGTASSTSSRRANDIIVAKQLSLVALSNLFCWFPVGIMGLLSLGKHEIGNDAYAWTTVIVLPINTAANPLLYTIPALMGKWEQFKHRDTRPR